MEETIRIQAVDKSDWTKALKAFQADQINQLFAVYGSDGSVVGNICELEEGKKYYIDGQPSVEYGNLQAAAGALIKGKA